MERLGAAEIDGPFGALSKLGTARRGEVLSVGLHVTADWPANFLRLLQKFSTNYSVGHWGAGKVYGYVYIWAKQLKGKIGDEVRAVMSEYYAGTMAVKSGTTISNIVESQFLSLNSASKNMGRSVEHVYSAMTELGLLASQGGKGTPLIVNRDDIPRIDGVLEDRIKFRSVDRILGCSQKDALALSEAKMLPHRIINFGKVPRIYFSRQELMTLLEECGQNVPFSSKIPSNAASFSYARKKLASQMGFAKFIKALTDREIKVIARIEGHGLNGIFIDTSAIPPKKKSNLMNVPNSAQYLFLIEDTVYALIKAKLLNITFEGHYMRISKPDLKRFKKNYITSSELGKTLYARKSLITYVLKLMRVKAAVSRNAQPLKLARQRTAIRVKRAKLSVI